jgi:hypothetical protein
MVPIRNITDSTYKRFLWTARLACWKVALIKPHFRRQAACLAYVLELGTWVTKPNKRV